MSQSKTANAKNTFESSLSALETIVRQLEQGDLPLEDSLRLFEDGVRLSRECQERLTQAERRIEVLLADADGNPALQAIGKEDLETPPAEPKIKRRIVFEDSKNEDDDDDTPF